MEWSILHTKDHGDLTEERLGMTTSLCGHLVFVLGGAKCTNEVQFVARKSAILNLQTKEWTPIEVELESWFHSTCLVDDRLIVIGGEDNDMDGTNRPPMAVSAVDMVSYQGSIVDSSVLLGQSKPCHTWKHIAEFIPAKREIVVHGGRYSTVDNDFANQLYALSVDNMKWRELSHRGRAPVNASSHMSCLNQRQDIAFVYVARYDMLERGDLYQLDYSGSVPAWGVVQTQGVAPVGLYGGMLAPVDECRIVMYGGVYNDAQSNRMYTFNSNECSWEETICLTAPEPGSSVGASRLEPLARLRHDYVRYNGKTLCFGGQGLAYISIKDVMVLEKLHPLRI